MAPRSKKYRFVPNSVQFTVISCLVISFDYIAAQLIFNTIRKCAGLDLSCIYSSTEAIADIRHFSAFWYHLANPEAKPGSFCGGSSWWKDQQACCHFQGHAPTQGRRSIMRQKDGLQIMNSTTSSEGNPNPQFVSRNNENDPGKTTLTVC
jgi:hypothetical protein